MDYHIIISCPHCQWQPDGGEYWLCTCGHRWDTFETMAECPSCNKKWDVTQCPLEPGGCLRISKHEDWYEILISTELFKYK